MLFLVKSSPVFLAHSIYYQYEILQGKLMHSEKNSWYCQQNSPQIPTWTAMGAIPGLVVGSRRLTVPGPEALRHEKFSTRNSSVIKYEYFQNSPPCFLTRTVSFEDKLPVKKQSTNTTVTWATLSLQGLQLPNNNNNNNNNNNKSKIFNTTRLQRKSGRSQYTDWAMGCSSEEIWLDSRKAERDFFLHHCVVQTTLGNLTAPFTIGFLRR